ncbi:hypothetical protein BRARA_E00344 [Brassica rapa]|uniref:Uncharacterized protein n=1 Tax=Brassica campestris TaxID=3711 RepID=A0A397Z6Q0_BRACM|nr:hypothetical protein BRARA_E00344 [Brassica rapa]CAG7873849.1 unnamed protein product [Brassica rapa]VDC69638.1 unnamed protein product [Brassica rapa]
MAATETVVHDPRQRSMDAIQQRLQKDQLRQQQQQQQKNEKDKKRASDVSSKEPHKPHSLPTPPTKKPITKDPQDDGFAAYTKLSHPVDEKLLATNVKLSSGKKNIADKVLHTLLRSGDSAQKYLQGKNEKKVEENNYILLDNFVQSRSSSSSSGSKKASLMNSKRSKTRMSMKRLKKSGALKLPQHLQKFDLYKPMHGMWESYMMKLIKVTGKAQLTSSLLSADLHGAFMFVPECKIASFTGVQGIMIRETSQTFGIITRDDKLRVVPKKPSVFIIQLDCWKITLHGDKFTSRDNVLQR